MANGVDDDLVSGDLIEDEIRIGRCRYAANAWIGRRRADIGILHEQVDDGANAGLHVARALRGPADDVVEDLIEISERW